VKLATLRDGTRDGRLLVVRADGAAAAPGPDAWPSLQRALDDWEAAEPALRALAARLDARALDGVPVDPTAPPFGGAAGRAQVPAIDLTAPPFGGAAGRAQVPAIDPTRLAAPLPRAYEWVDGSAFLNHVILVRKARGAEPPKTLETDPLIYQGGSGDLLGPRDPIELRDPAWGLDFASEVCVVLGDTPVGTTAADAGKYVRLVMLANDCTLRNLIPEELAKSFGFFQSKPATAFSPFAVTPDELGGAWRDGRAHLRVRSTYNGQVVGDCEAGPEMHFSFFDLIAHVAKTRRFTAGTILGSGTVSNADRARGISCLAERRMIEIIETGKPSTPFMAVGDRIVIDAVDAAGGSPFGAIDQKVVAP
jgi:fumarylacetoacetate (FAA) hydrolase